MKSHSRLERSGRIRILKEISKYQFGVDIIPEESLSAEISRTGKLRILYYRGKRFLGLNAKTTTIILYLEAGKRLFELSQRWRVYIKSKDLLVTDLFARHVEKADPMIRPNDEVLIVYGDELIAVGKAKISGRSMHADRVVAVKVREKITRRISRRA